MTSAPSPGETTETEAASNTAHAGAGPNSRARRLTLLLVVLALIVIAIDQATKQLALSRLQVGEYHPVIGDFLGWQLVFNPGAAFSLASGMTWVFTIVSLVVVVVIFRISRRLGSLSWAIALGLLLGGAVGNLIDRLARDPGFAQGHVIDFINYNGWFVGNVADIAIVGSAAMIVILALIGRDVDGARVGATRDDGEEGELATEPALDEATYPDDEADVPNRDGATAHGRDDLADDKPEDGAQRG